MIASLGSLEPTSMRFKAEIGRSEASSLFEIEYPGNRYALKVFHDNGDPGFTERSRSQPLSEEDQREGLPPNTKFY